MIIDERVLKESGKNTVTCKRYKKGYSAKRCK